MPEYITSFLISTFAPVLISAVTMVAVFYVRKLAMAAVDYLTVKMGKDEWARLSSMVDDIVHGIEQSPQFKDMVGAAKKETAMLMVRQFALLTGITMTEQQVDILIEAAVSRLGVTIPEAAVSRLTVAG